MKVEAITPVTHGDKLHQPGEQFELAKEAAEHLIDIGAVKEVKATAKKEE